MDIPLSSKLKCVILNEVKNPFRPFASLRVKVFLPRLRRGESPLLYQFTYELHRFVRTVYETVDIHVFFIY
ncbi:MAG: hypothetical protein Q7J22_01565, partial [Candidatus Wolfebacteria bacterium]|nr:hypothetical protein [Candidatus Wolfebacteria bacterium]